MNQRYQRSGEGERSREAYMPDFNLENWPFDEVAVTILHRIVCDHEDVKIVMSSTWRRTNSWIANADVSV